MSSTQQRLTVSFAKLTEAVELEARFQFELLRQQFTYVPYEDVVKGRADLLRRLWTRDSSRMTPR